MIYDIKGETDHRQITAEVHVETPAADFFNLRTVTVYIHRFANIEFNDGYAEECPDFWCFGHKWNLEFKWSGSGDVVNVHLHHRSKTAVVIFFDIAARRSFNKWIPIGKNSVKFDDGCTSRLVGNITVDIAMDNLVGGALVLEVQMSKPLNYEPPAFIPVNPSACRTVQDMFMDDETSDVTFEVGGERAMDESGTKVMKTEPTKFCAHLVILKKCAPVLANMRNSNAPSDPIQLPGVSPATFNHLLEYVYGREPADFGTDALQVKEIMEAADKYGVAYLKLKAEAQYVSSIKVTFDNVMENLHYADSMNCALLKEVVIDFIVKNRAEIIRRNFMKDAPGGLINDVLAATIRNENEGFEDADDVNAMSINEIRRRAHEKGLDVDGSRESLISSLLALEDE